jgi:hypothetical protein
MRKVFGTKREDITGDWRKRSIMRCCMIYTPRHMLWLLNTKKVRGIGHVAQMGMKTNSYRIWVGRSEGRNHLKELSIDDRVILKQILKKYDGKKCIVMWRDITKAVMNLRVSWNVENFLSA